MLNIKILGSGCANCKRLASVTEHAALALKLDVHLEKVTDTVEIMKYPILSTPGLVINEELVSFGRIPGEAEIKNWLTAASQAPATN